MNRAFWLGLWLLPCMAMAAEKEKLALLPVQSDQSLKEQARIMEDLIAADVAKMGRFEVLSSNDVATMISTERQAELAGCDEHTECIKEVAAALGAGRLLAATLGRLGDDQLISMRLIDFASGKVVAREVEQVRPNESVTAACHRLVALVLGGPPPAAPSRVPRAGWFVLGGAGVLAIGGLSVGLSAQADANSFKTQVNNDALANQALGKSYAADGLYAGAVVTAAVAAVMLVLTRNDE